jgi:multidrug efflux pump subunit AcrB
MDIAKFSIKNKLLIYILTILAIAYGMIVYDKMGKLQDPEFTIKDAIIITNYAGASALEVEKEVSNKIEEAIQKLPYVKKIRSKSKSGQSLIIVSMKNKYNKKHLPQIWDELRRKMKEVQPYLPPRAGDIYVNDDFGDVYGVMLAIYGDEYSYDELKDYIDYLKKELILVEGVGKIDTYGEQQRVIKIEIKKELLAKLGINKSQILAELNGKNLVPNYGKVKIGKEYISIRANSDIASVDDLSKIMIKGVKGDSQIFLKDIATITDTYKEPTSTILNYDNHNAIALGISTISGGNVVDMGEKLNKKLKELESHKPLGIEVGIISHQAKDVELAINSFMINLLEAIAIVIVVLLLFMGLKSGLIIGFVLLVTIISSFIFMPTLGIMLERISLGALVIALGMLVDNAIVVVDGILARINRGMNIVESASDTVKQTAMPLLAATAIAILAFGSIGLSEDMTGEYTQSLFWVIFISLSLSWVTAMTLTPVLAIQFLKPKKETKEEYNSFIYKLYGKSLKFAINYKYLVLVFAFGVFGYSLYNFKYVKQNFFPDSSRPQIMVDYILPEGSSIYTTEEYMQNITKDIQKIDGVEHISSFIGSGALRFLLTYTPTHPNSAYAQMLIDVKDYTMSDSIIPKIETMLKEKYPYLNGYARKFILGPGDGGKVQIKIFGDDLDKLREYESKILDIVRDEPLAKGVRSDWGERVKVVKPIISDEKANLNGITRDDIANAIIETFEGRSVGIYREKTELIPIILQAPKSESSDIKNIQNIQIFSPVANKMIPLRQIVTSFETVWEDNIIYRYNRKRAITIHADPILGHIPNELLSNIKDKIESIDYSDGYYIEWHGEYKDSRDAQKPIMESLPFFMILMMLIVIGLFNSVKKMLVIWLTLPFALIGVVLGLIVMAKPFGFMSLLGFLSLSGMLIKNAIVLLDEIDIEHKVKNTPLNKAIYNSGLSRLRAVSMAALTTALGMLPLMSDAFFGSMAVVIIFGLMVATMLTMIMIPVLYAIFYRVDKLQE